MLSAVGRQTLAFLEATGLVLAFATRSVARTVVSTDALGATLTQSAVLVLRCAVPVVLVCAPIGAMLAMQSLAITRAFGVDRLLPPLLAATIVRELAPGFAAVMVCFQAGAGVSAELGTMKVQEELDALAVMGIDARALVVGPRVLGTAVAAVLLNAAAIVTGMLGGWAVAVPLGGMGHAGFMDALFQGLSLGDLWLSEVKSLVFGLTIGAISVTFGCHASGGPAGVGRAANRTVVASVICVLVANYFVNTLLFGLRGAGS
jgi:phospholipid/cholesterol/gamma-HCH transport system permease protein